MGNHILNKSINREFSIKTTQGEVKITWPQNQQPGFCPHCHKCIPLSSIVFKKESSNEIETYSGVEAVLERKYTIQKGQDGEHQSRIGECPYCHKAIPVREVIFKRAD